MKKIFLFSCLVYFLSPLCKADNYFVTNSNDSGSGSLRAAIDSANARSGLDSIFVILTSSDTIYPVSGYYSITDSLVICGPNSGNPVLLGHANLRLAFVAKSFFVLNNIDIFEFSGFPDILSGAGIYSDTTLYLNNCFFYANTTLEPCLQGPGWGGAVSANVIYANNCTFYQNGGWGEAGGESDWGGAVACNTGHFENCVFYQNYSMTNNGGAIALISGSIHHCIFSGNYSFYGGAVVVPYGQVDISNNIFWKDSTTGGIYGDEIKFSTSAISSGCNVISDTTNSGFALLNTDVWGLDPQFGDFGYHGGPVPVLPVTNQEVSSVFDSCKLQASCSFSYDSINFSISQGDTVFIGSTAFTRTGTYTDTLTNFRRCDSVVTLYLTVTNPEGINNLSLNTLFSLHPNPANDYSYIDFDVSLIGADFSLSDITGRELMNTRLILTPQQLPIGNLTPGIYLVSVNSNGQTSVRLLSKN